MNSVNRHNLIDHRLLDLHRRIRSRFLKDPLDRPGNIGSCSSALATELGMFLIRCSKMEIVSFMKHKQHIASFRVGE